MSIELERTSIGAQQAGNASQARVGLLSSLVVSLLIGVAVWFLAAVIPDKIANPFEPVRDVSAWLSETRIGRGLLESLYAFPIVEGLHLMGIALSVGVLCWFDLRLLGLVLRDHPVSVVWRQTMPIARAGFFLVFATGGLLFAAEAMTAHDSVHFWIKMGLIVLAGLNAAYFEFKLRRGIAAWDEMPVPPFAVRMTGMLSLVFWTAIIITGRTMAYSF